MNPEPSLAEKRLAAAIQQALRDAKVRPSLPLKVRYEAARRVLAYIEEVEHGSATTA